MKIVAACIVVVTAMAVQGCKRQASPAAQQPVVRSAPPVKTVPDFTVGPLPVEKESASARRRTPQVGRVQPQPVQGQAETQAAADAAQRQQDAKLLQQEQEESRRQQQELDQQIQQAVKRQEEMQAEPRIQGIPEQPLPPPPIQPTQPQ